MRAVESLTAVSFQRPKTFLLSQVILVHVSIPVKAIVRLQCSHLGVCEVNPLLGRLAKCQTILYLKAPTWSLVQTWLNEASMYDESPLGKILIRVSNLYFDYKNLTLDIVT